MRVLLLGGSGTISSYVTTRLYATGHDVFTINRGKQSDFLHELCDKFVTPSCMKGSLTELSSNVYNQTELSRAVEDILKDGEKFDAIVDFIAYTPEHVQKDYEIFKGKTKQFVFISSASAYQKPLSNHVITESTSLANPYWQYSRDKIACEDFLMKKYRENGFPITIVRPSHTYSERSIPLGVHGNNGSWQVVKRMLGGKKVIIHGDGSSLWTMTHAEDFAKGFCGLLGNIHAIGESFHITSDESLSWNQIYTCLANALDVPLNGMHVASDFLAKSSAYDLYGSLLGDKANSVIFDNTKIKKVVPNYVASIRFDEGIKRVVDYILLHSSLQKEDLEFDAWCDVVIGAQEHAINSMGTFGNQ